VTANGDIPRRATDPASPAIAALALALLVGCTTTHALGRIDDPAARERLGLVVASGGTVASLRADPATNGLPISHRVADLTPAGLLIAPADPQPSVVVPLSEVASVSRHDRLRGAGEAAVGAGIAGFAAGLMIGIVSTMGGTCADDCPPRGSPVAVGLRWGALSGLVAAVAGAGLGAIRGHEERYVFTPP
jgi:hypothetical protein